MPSHLMLTYSFTSLCLIGLLGLTLVAIDGVLRYMVQTQRISRLLSRKSQNEDSKLSSTLQQTRLDQSILDRPAQWFDAQIVRIDQESADVKSFYLVDQTQNVLPKYLPGQHVLLERPAYADRPAECRCYSLSEDCHAGYWRISVKKVSGEPQSVSRWLHDDASVGDVLRVRGPSGSFHLQSCTNRHVVLLSAGIGITPMLPMLKESLNRPCASLRLLAQFRDVDHMPFADVLLRLANRNRHAQFRLWLSRFPRGVKGSDTSMIQEGKLTAYDVCHDLPSPESTDVYMCGPEGWQNEIKAGLIDYGIPAEQIYYELFHSTESPMPSSKPNDMPCSVHFRQSNKLSAYAASYPNLLGFAIQSDIPLNSGCRTGACGSCAVRLIEGKVRYTRKPQYPLKRNEILPCVCVPEGDIVVDA